MAQTRVNPLLSKFRVDAVETLMDAYRAAGITIRDSIDGGAGAGAMTTKMVERSEGTVYAYEPFPGNHAFWKPMDRVELRKAALAEEAGQRTFYVSSTVTADSGWGKNGMAGYSSMGYIVDEFKTIDLKQVGEEKTYTVPCEAADEALPSDAAIDVVKLDLQGGELNALKGMERIAQAARFLWIEYTAQPGLADYLADRGFVLFDTEYFFMDEPSPEIEARFVLTKPNVELSTGRTACFGFATEDFGTRYEAAFQEMKKSLGLIQTDLVAVHRGQIEWFLEAVARLPLPEALPAGSSAVGGG